MDLNKNVTFLYHIKLETPEPNWYYPLLFKKMSYGRHVSAIAFKWITLNEMENSCFNVNRGNEKHPTTFAF